MSFMPTPMCLVANTEDGKLVLQEETVRILSQIKKPTVVVAIVGTYRTGKSFLMNRLMGRNNGFALGATVESKTKGIWAWYRRHPRQLGCYLLLLDTEGLGDIDKTDDNNDNWIFALSVLLSSTLVYNWQSSLQANALGKLHQLTDLIKAKSSQDKAAVNGEEFIKFFPNFVWVLRDFTLILEMDGTPITADQYLRNALKQKIGISSKVMEYNLPRRCIEEYFKEKKCFVLKRPVDDDELFSKLEILRDEELKQDFLREVQNFCEYIFTSATPKSVEGKQLNGSMICQLLETFLQTIQSGRILCMENAVKTMTEIENGKAVQKAIDHYKNTMAKSLRLPVSLDELSKEHGSRFGEAMKIFRCESISEESKKHQTELEYDGVMEKEIISHHTWLYLVQKYCQVCKEVIKILKAWQFRLAEEYKNKCEENIKASQTFCSELLDCLSKALDQKVTDGVFSKPGGYKNYCREKQKVISAYQRAQWKGIMAEVTLRARLRLWESREALIAKADTHLTEAAHKAEKVKRMCEIAKQEKLLAERKLAQQQQMIKDLEEGYKKSEEMMQQKFNQEKQQFIEESEKIIKQKEEELKKADEEGRKQEAEKKKIVISSLRKEIEAKKQTQNEQPGYVRVVQTVTRVITQALLYWFFPWW